MSPQDRLAVADGLDLTPILRVLMEKWPILVTLTPESIGLADGERSTFDFLGAVRTLSDMGLLSYEALLIGPDGPIVIDAALTARGRAAYND